MHPVEASPTDRDGTSTFTAWACPDPSAEVKLRRGVVLALFTSSPTPDHPPRSSGLGPCEGLDVQPLRIRRSDSAPGLSRDQYFGRLGESEVGDIDLSNDAKVLLVAVRLHMSLNQNRDVCLATNLELAQICGRTGLPRSRERWVCRWLAQLVERGHVVAEPVRTLPKSPRGIRPLGRLRGARSTQTKASGCTTTGLSGSADSCDAAPRQDRRGSTTALTVPLKREGKKRDPEKGPATSAATGNGSPPPPSQLEESPEDVDAALAALRAQLPGLGASTRSKPGARKGPGVIRQDPPGASGLSVPDTGDRRTEPGGPSTPERGGE